MHGLPKAFGAGFLVALLLLGAVCLPNRVLAGEDDSSETGGYTGLGRITSAQLEEPGPVEMMIDGILVRPISLAATLIGTAFFIITLPFSAPSGSVDDAAETLVAGPAAYTFTRCLGCWRPQYIEADAAED